VACAQNLTPAEVDEMMAEVDEDGTGQIDFEEFMVPPSPINTTVFRPRPPHLFSVSPNPAWHP
jgi:hypothetical protein